MKKPLLIFALFTLAFYSEVLAQATNSGFGGYFGTNPATEYLGGDNITCIDLQIRHDAVRPITFHTGPAWDGTTTERMRITPTNGFVGIGLTAPQNKLHLDVMDTSNPVYSQWTNGWFTPANPPETALALEHQLTRKYCIYTMVFLLFKP